MRFPVGAGKSLIPIFPARPESLMADAERSGIRAAVSYFAPASTRRMNFVFPAFLKAAYGFGCFEHSRASYVHKLALHTTGH